MIVAICFDKSLQKVYTYEIQIQVFSRVQIAAKYK